MAQHLFLLMVVLAVLMVITFVAMLLHSSQQKSQSQQLSRYVARIEKLEVEHGKWLLKMVTDKERERLQQLLANAGFLERQALVYLLIAKLVTGIGLVAILVVRQSLNGDDLLSLWTLTIALVGYVIGANLPEWWLNLNADRHRKQLKRAAPDAIDLLVLCVESGLSLNKAFLRVASYLKMQGSPMAEQFRITSAELDMLNDRHQALANLSWRTGVSELHTLASTLQMADKYGSPLATTLRQISEDARRQRTLYLEEQAGKLPGKITLIQMALIMLPMLVMIIAPILHQLLTSLR